LNPDPFIFSANLGSGSATKLKGSQKLVHVKTKIYIIDFYIQKESIEETEPGDKRVETAFR